MMFWLFNSKPWFRPKTYGFGAGLPVAWQGWVLLGLHVALIIGSTLLLKHKPVAMSAAVVIATVLPLPVYASRTEGGWRWRWGSNK